MGIRAWVHSLTRSRALLLLPPVLGEALTGRRATSQRCSGGCSSVALLAALLHRTLEPLLPLVWLSP